MPRSRLTRMKGLAASPCDSTKARAWSGVAAPVGTFFAEPQPHIENPGSNDVISARPKPAKKAVRSCRTRSETSCTAIDSRWEAAPLQAARGLRTRCKPQGPMARDILNLVEAAYDVEQAEPAWLDGVLAA